MTIIPREPDPESTLSPPSKRYTYLDQQLDRCALCGNQCGANRITGEETVCGAALEAEVAWIGVHKGEEPPISGQRGCGNIFFQHCCLACVYCQNWQISNSDSVPSTRHSAESLAWEMLRLQEAGVHSVGLVTPTSHLPTIAKALVRAKSLGLRVPVVYNSSGYDSVEALRAMEGLVDVYLPDMKYASDSMARVYSGIDDYVATSRKAVLEMARQVGNGLQLDSSGIVTRGLLVRHLVLPGGLSDTVEVLEWLGRNLGTDVAVSLMSQYKPAYQACTGLYPELSEKLSAEEYDFYLAVAQGIGLKNIFVQELESSETYNPDFQSDTPFDRPGDSG